MPKPPLPARPPACLPAIKAKQSKPNQTKSKASSPLSLQSLRCTQLSLPRTTDTHGSHIQACGRQRDSQVALPFPFPAHRYRMCFFQHAVLLPWSLFSLVCSCIYPLYPRMLSQVHCLCLCLSCIYVCDACACSTASLLTLLLLMLHTIVALGFAPKRSQTLHLRLLFFFLLPLTNAQ